MKSVLLLVHRLPFPPDKGDKIRSFHLLTELRKHFRVFLGTFIDDSNDLSHVPHVASMCEELECIQMSRPGCYFRSVLGLLQGRSITTSWYRMRQMRAWVDDIADRHELTAAVAFSSGMAQFLPDSKKCAIRIMDFVDLDSAKWEQLAGSHSWPKRYVFAREARLVAREEIDIANSVNYSTFVSPEEAELLRNKVRDKSGVVAVRNGIDCEYFDPAIELPSPFKDDELPLVFTGAMDYWANAEAACWFVDSVMPYLRKKADGATFYIVGGNPTRAVRKLENEVDVVVTGRVPDVRPYLRYARVIVAPLKLARGVQNKVLEAMALARPLVATSAAIEGIGDPGDAGLIIADSEVEFADACARGLRLEGQDSSRPELRAYVLAKFSWQQNLKPMMQLIDAGSERGI